MEPSKLYDNLDDNSKLQLRRIADEINRGKVILFIGAGVNYQAPLNFEEAYSKNDRPPLGSELGKKFIETICQDDTTRDRYNEMMEDRYPLSWITQYYESATDRPALIEKLKEHMGNSKPSPLLKSLAAMPFKYIVTTNYDNLFEEALTLAGKDYHKGIYKPNKNTEPDATDDVEEKYVTENKPFLFKLHGDLDIIFDNEKEDYTANSDAIVLTDEDYLHFILRMGQVVNNIERPDNQEQQKNFNPIPQSINMAFSGMNGKRFLFIGYSLRDYNLRLIFKTALWKKDNNIFKELQKWSIDTKPDEAIKSIWIKNYNLTFIEQDIWNTIPFLHKKVFNDEIPLT